MKTVKDLKVLSLFSGCGGMDLGFEGDFEVHSACVNPNIHTDWISESDKEWVRVPPTRFKTVFSNDILRAGKAAWAPYFAKRGATTDAYKLESIVDLVKKARTGNFDFPEVDVVTGGFPCQDFSLAGKRKGFKSDKAHHGKLLGDDDDPSEENRGKLYMWMREVVGLTLPRIFVAENVKGLASLSNVKSIIESDFRNVGPGYVVLDAKVLKAPEYGVPQNRERVIFIGFREDALTKEALKIYKSKKEVPDEFDPYPPKTHSKTNEGALKPYTTLRECFAGLKEPSESDDPAQQAFSKAKWYGTHCQGQIEVKLDRISPTIRAEHHGNIEFRRLSEEHGGKYLDELSAGMPERRLTVRECARIQTFPNNYEFVRPAKALGSEFALSKTNGYKVIGNAVPPLLAAHIAHRLQELWPKVVRNACSKSAAEVPAQLEFPF
ncbi:MAG: DNA (cytosine-5-)-methyltransferase [Victivallales bacterium]|nr:DNA (cytosine-5-)-methyltransferase [Victivallales bacterium]